MQRAIQISGPQRNEKGNDKRVDAEAIKIKGPDTDEKGDDKESGWMQGLYRSRARGERITATIQKVGPEAIQIKGPQRQGDGDNTESGSTGYTDQAPTY